MHVPADGHARDPQQPGGGAHRESLQLGLADRLPARLPAWVGEATWTCPCLRSGPVGCGPVRRRRELRSAWRVVAGTEARGDPFERGVARQFGAALAQQPGSVRGDRYRRVRRAGRGLDLGLESVVVLDPTTAPASSTPMRITPPVAFANAQISRPRSDGTEEDRHPSRHPDREAHQREQRSPVRSRPLPPAQELAGVHAERDRHLLPRKLCQFLECLEPRTKVLRDQRDPRRQRSVAWCWTASRPSRPSHGR